MFSVAHIHTTCMFGQSGCRMHFSFYMSEAPKEKYAEWKTGSGSRGSIVSAIEKVQKPFTTTVSICRRDLHYIIYIAQCINTCKCKRVYIYIYAYIYIYIEDYIGVHCYTMLYINMRADCSCPRVWASSHIYIYIYRWKST